MYTGFVPKKEFTTEPRVAVAQALKDMSRNFGEPVTKAGDMRPYPKCHYGAVLAGEYAHGMGENGDANVFKETGSGRVLSRYVFLVPSDVKTEEIPRGKDIEKALSKGFQKLRNLEWTEVSEEEVEESEGEDEEV